jgi:hypothetical protein
MWATYISRHVVFVGEGSFRLNVFSSVLPFSLFDMLLVIYPRWQFTYFCLNLAPYILFTFFGCFVLLMFDRFLSFVHLSCVTNSFTHLGAKEGSQANYLVS